MFVFLPICLMATSVAFAAEPLKIVDFGFEEGFGSYSDDASGARRSAEFTPSAKWAVGAFGAALATGEREAGALIGPIPDLNGSSPFTVFLRFRREGAGFGPHPCLLSTSDWGNGGLLFFAALVFVSNETIAPKRVLSRICYGIFGGLTAMLLRRYSPLEESTVFSVLLMNSVSTVFDSKLPVIGLEKKHLFKQLEDAKEEQLRLEKELEEVEKAQREENELAEISAKIESKRSAMVQSISQSIQSQAIAELEDIPDEIPLVAEDEASDGVDKKAEQTPAE